MRGKYEAHWVGPNDSLLEFCKLDGDTWAEAMFDASRFGVPEGTIQIEIIELDPSEWEDEE